MFKTMFNNIGGKLQKLAKVIAILFLAGGVLCLLIGGSKYLSNRDLIGYASIYGGAGYGYELLTEAGNQAVMGLKLLTHGLPLCVIGFFSSWPLYGFGNLIEKVDLIASRMPVPEQEKEPEPVQQD